MSRVVPVVRFTRPDGSRAAIRYSTLARAQRDAAMTAGIWPDVRAELVTVSSWWDRLRARLPA